MKLDAKLLLNLHRLIRSQIDEIPLQPPFLLPQDRCGDFTP